jgi:hypothetical protein
MISAPKIDTDLLWALALFFGVLLLVYFVTVFYFRNRISKTNHKVRKKKRELSPMISEFLFYDENGSKSEKMTYIDLKIQIREMIHYPFDRKVLTDVLMDLRKDVAGQSRKDLFRLYKDLELHKDAYKRLESWRWEVVSKGILELTQMQVAEAYGHITRFINDRRPTIRRQAEIAAVTLKEEGIHYFLDHTTYSISEWQQVKLMEELKGKENFDPPPFRLWLTSRNTDVVLFALRLIKHYQQADSIASIITLVQHKHPQIKKEAILCLRDFHATKAVPTLKKVFHHNPEEVKMYLLDALSHLASKEDLPFLQEVVDTESSFRVKNKAVAAINTICPEVVMPSKDIEAHPVGPDTVSQNLLAEPGAIAEEGMPTTTVPLETQTEPKEEIHITAMEHTMEDGELTSRAKDELFKEPDTVALEDLSFLPWVTSVESEEPSPPAKKALEPEDIFFTLDFLPIVTPVKQEDEPLPTQKELVPKPHPTHSTTEIRVNYEVVPSISLRNEAIIPFQVDATAIADINVVFEELTLETVAPFDGADTFIEWDQAFADAPEPKASLAPEEEVPLLGFDFELDLPQQEESWLPKAEFSSEEEMEKMALLDQIAELGDHREILLLKEMDQTEASPWVKQRIQELIVQFSEEDGGVEFFKVMEFEPIDSVFHALINKSDVESKRILLKEMAQVGDQKEIPLLKELLKDNDPSIAQAAKNTLEAIVARLAPEPVAQAPQAARSKDPSDGNTLFDQWASYLFKNYAEKNE